MKKKSVDKEYKCFDEPVFLGLYVFTVFMFCVFLASIIAVTVCLINGLEFIPGGLVVLMCLSLPTLISSAVSFKSLHGSKQGVFRINEEYCILNSKVKGEIINLKLRNTDIKRIEIRDFSKTRRAVCIVFIDEKGTYGDTVFTKNGEYIKLRYTKKRLKNIQEFLPDSVVYYSNVQPDEI